MIMEIVLFFSVALNLLSFFYIKWLLKNYNILSEDIQSVTVLIQDYVDHISKIHELEMFYGDETLGGMISHGKELVDILTDIDLISDTEGVPLEDPEGGSKKDAS